MNIAIFGTGNMASGLVTLFTKAGHNFTLASTDSVKAQTVAAKLGTGIGVSSLADAAGAADAVVLAVPYAGDDAEARESVVSLAKSAGLAAVETGGLASARYLEPLAGLNIALGYGLDHGTDIAPTWQGIA
jgi:8-hydroxy-5-deazaflavin:NADPH oxidoreductase